MSILIFSSVTIVVLILFSGCKKIDTDNGSLVNDIDGNTYHIVTIETQDWMKENLKTKKYRNGDPIYNVYDSVDWNIVSSTVFGEYCSFENNPENEDIYGFLYNWYAVNDSRNIAPAGWHVATDEDWKTLVNYLGGDSISGGKLKETGTKHWYSPNTGSTNETGFTALPGGYIFSNGEFRDLRSYGSWWSSSEYSSDFAWR